MANIDPLKFGVTGNQYYRPETNDDADKKLTQENKHGEKQEKQISSKDVLAFLEAKNAAFVPIVAPKVLEPSKYVSKEQEARIEEFMKQFEADYDEAVAIAKDEFGISSEAAGEVALAYIDSTY